jgi:hypothetical protein
MPSTRKNRGRAAAQTSLSRPKNPAQNLENAETHLFFSSLLTRAARTLLRELSIRFRKGFHRR